MDPYGDLNENEVAVVHDERFLHTADGILIAKYPCQTVFDVEFARTVRRPEEQDKRYARHGVYVSAKGRGVSGMSGADLDGDTVLVAFNARLVEVVKRTQKYPTSQFEVDRSIM